MKYNDIIFPCFSSSPSSPSLGLFYFFIASLGAAHLQLKCFPLSEFRYNCSVRDVLPHCFEKSRATRSSLNIGPSHCYTSFFPVINILSILTRSAVANKSRFPSEFTGFKLYRSPKLHSSLYKFPFHERHDIGDKLLSLQQ